MLGEVRRHGSGVIVIDCNEVQEVRDDVVVCLEALWFKQPLLVCPSQGGKMSETLNFHVCPERNSLIQAMFHYIRIQCKGGGGRGLERALSTDC